MIKRLLMIGLLTINNLYSNELIHEESPYLQQHAHNPVDWLPWGDKALQKAKKENKLIFLSIGYSTCHWCHVMEHESFENEKIAKQLNQNFISIKVDREEHPNIDKYYQKVYQQMNNRGGGWPLTVIMTPDAKVFFTATYIPSKAKYSYKSLPQILEELVQLYKERKEDIYRTAEHLKSALAMQERPQNSKASIDQNLSNVFVEQIKQSYDYDYKGIGTQPKFPHATSFDTLLDIARLDNNAEATKLATDALIAMAKGGINDQIEGGFYRYSTDEMWMIPHFEKMLYTNAELLESFSNAYQVTKKSYLQETIKTTIENIYKRFEKNNLFYSASDADSEGEEGKYFLFNYQEAKKALEAEQFSKKEIEEALDYFHITKTGNFEGKKNNPYLDEEKAPKHLAKIKKVLKNIRSKRTYPFIDYKVQTSWNALFIHGLFKAHEDKKALKSINALVRNLYIHDELYHQMIRGKTSKVKGYLEDYAFLSQALIDAYQATLDEQYLKLAKKLSQTSLKKFYRDGIWFMSDDSFKTKAELFDSSYRSAMAVQLESLLKLAVLEEDFDAYEQTKKMIKTHADKINSMPSGFAYATKVALMLQHPLVLLKSTKENLLSNRDKISKINYPFVLISVVKESDFSACTMKSCFSSHDTIDKTILDIEGL